jgi:hypothetical protein
MLRHHAALASGKLTRVTSGVNLPPLEVVIMSRLPICSIIRRLVVCSDMDFEIIGEITHTETIASGSGVRERARLRRQHGQGRWRKLKGIARVRLINGAIRLAEVH